MIDRRIKFRHIQCFVEIAREGSFKIAAEKLFLTQPAISKTLKELELILGQALFTRNRGGVALTREGETFLHFAQMSIASLQQGIDGMRQHDDQLRRLSVGVLPSVAARLVPMVVDRLRQKAPDLVLQISDGPVGYLLERLKLADLDLVIGRMGDDAQMKGVSFTTLYREKIRFVVRRDHPLLAKPSLEAIVDWPVVYPSEGSAIRSSVDRFLTENGIGEVTRHIETVSGAFGRVFVKDSDAVWIISDGVVANEIANGTLAHLPFNTDTTLGSIGIMARVDWDYTAEAKTLRKVMLEVIEEHPELRG